MSVTLFSTAPGSGSSDPFVINGLGTVMNWKHTATFPGGASAAEFDLLAPDNFTHRALLPGRVITAKLGSAVAWRGRLEQPVAGDPWHLTCSGNASRGKDFRLGNANIYGLDLTSVQAAGLPWTVAPGSPLTGPAGNAGPYTDTVDGVLGVLVRQGGYWRLDRNDVVSTPTAPDALGYVLKVVDRPTGRSLDGNYANALVGIYTDSTTNATTTFSVMGSAALADQARFGRIDAFLDLTSQGPMSSGAATAAGIPVLARYLASVPYTSQLTVGKGDLRTLQGARVHPGLVRPGITVNVFAPKADTWVLYAPTVTVPIGQVDYDDETETCALTPLASDQQDFTSVLAGAA